MSRKPGPSRDDMRRVQDQFLELPQVMRFAREHGEDVPLSHPINQNPLGLPSIAQIRAVLYPELLWWFRECVDNQEV